MAPWLRVVPMEEKHVSALAELERLCFAEPRSPALLRAEVKNPLARFFVAEYDGGTGDFQVAGYAGMQNIAGECYVENIAVFPALRGRGVGRALTRRLLETAQKEHAAFLTLEVRPSNRTAVGLYESLGFETVGERKGFYRHPTENALIMTCYFQESGEVERGSANESAHKNFGD